MLTTRGDTKVGSGGDGTSFTWTPKNLGTRLLYWYYLRGLLNVNGVSVTAMPDQSSYARPALTAISTPRAPISQAPGLNGLTTLRFTSGSQQQMSSLFTVAKPIHFFMVMRNRVSQFQYFIDGGAAGEMGMLDDAAGHFFQAAPGNGGSCAQPAINTWTLLEGFYNGASLTNFARRDRTFFGNGVNPGASGLTGLTIASFGDATNCASMDFAELIGVDCSGAYATTGLTGLPLYQVQKFLNSTWGV